MLHQPDRPPEDGRVARSYRTIEKITQAMRDLLERDGERRPTADQVSTRAGVSRRALYLHFDSLEILFARAFQRRVYEVSADLRPPPPDSSLEVRIDWFATSWSELLERLLPYSRASLQYEPFSPEVSKTLESIRAWMRAVTESVFQHELSACDDDDRALLVTSLRYLASCTAWASVRDQGADPLQASQALHLLLCKLLVESTPRSARRL